MEAYSVLKLVHVLSAIVWVGGGFVLVLLGIVARRAQSEADLMAVLRQVGFVGPRLFLPASLATLVSGLATVLAGGIAWEAWLVLGLAGTFATAVFGHFVLRPRAERAMAFLPDRHRRREGIEASAELFALARIDYALLFSVVALMVLKPGWDDIAILGVLAATVAAAALMTRLGARAAA